MHATTPPAPASTHELVARPRDGGLSLQFLGAAGTVTGSRTLVEAGGARLLVDCGLFQGYKSLRLRNWAPFPVRAEAIDAVLLTHAHLDHSGYLPRLVRDGFAGRVWCAPGTAALCRILLPDAASLMEEEAAYANREGTSRHRPALPLFTRADVRRCLDRLGEVEFERDFEPVRGVTARFCRQGHILGASAVRLAHHGPSVLFSGDVGRADDPVMRPPSACAGADWIVCESTYGNRTHPRVDAATELATALKRVLGRGGVAVVPAFAVGRAQMLLHLVEKLQAEGKVPRVPVYLDSPMAADVTALYARLPAQHRLTNASLAALRANTRFVTSLEQSRALGHRREPMVIVAGSGMVTGGRVLHHLEAFAGDERNAVLLTGFQAGGTRGAALVRGERVLRIHRRDVAIAAEVVVLEGASAHADADGLLDWLRSAPRAPAAVFVTHGEPDASDALRLRIERELGWPARAPDHLERVDLAPSPRSELAA